MIQLHEPLKFAPKNRLWCILVHIREPAPQNRMKPCQTALITIRISPYTSADQPYTLYNYHAGNFRTDDIMRQERFSHRQRTPCFFHSSPEISWWWIEQKGSLIACKFSVCYSLQTSPESRRDILFRPLQADYTFSSETSVSTNNGCIHSVKTG